jgi:hypothetical protein
MPSRAEINQNTLISNVLKDRRYQAIATLTTRSISTGVRSLLAQKTGRDATTGLTELVLPDGAIAFAQDIGFNALATGETIPTVIADGTGNWLDHN